MMFKVFLVAAVLAAACARPNNSHGEGHGYSSQSFVVDHTHNHKHAPLHQEEHYYDHHDYHKQHGHASSSQSLKQYHGGHETKHVDNHAHPKYEFAYEVMDPHTHDMKQQHEHRDGDRVTGAYELLQPDGRIRHVKYHADQKTGFHADVMYEGDAKPVPQHQSLLLA